MGYPRQSPYSEIVKLVKNDIVLIGIQRYGQWIGLLKMNINSFGWHARNHVFIVVYIKKGKGGIRKYFALSRDYLCWDVVKRELAQFIEERMKMTKYKIVSDDDTKAHIDDHYLKYLLCSEKKALFFTVTEKLGDVQNSTKK